jgi:hypothetical protein
MKITVNSSKPEGLLSADSAMMVPGTIYLVDTPGGLCQKNRLVAVSGDRAHFLGEEGKHSRAVPLDFPFFTNARKVRAIAVEI